MLKYHYSFLVVIGSLLFSYPMSAMQEDDSFKYRQGVTRKGPPRKALPTPPSRKTRAVMTHHAAHPAPSRSRGRPTSGRRMHAIEKDRFKRRLQCVQEQQALKHQLPSGLTNCSISKLLKAKHTGSSTEPVEIGSGIKVSVKCVLAQLQAVQNSINAIQKNKPGARITARKGEVIAHSYNGKTAKSEGDDARGRLVVYKLLADGVPITYKYEDHMGLIRTKEATLTLSITTKG